MTAISPSEPADGEIPVTVGAPEANRAAAELSDVPAAFVTATSAPPRRVVGELAVMTSGDRTVTPVAGMAPKSTMSPGEKSVPVIVTSVDEPTGPVSGAIVVTVGVP
jgi:hypothetical protein